MEDLAPPERLAADIYEPGADVESGDRKGPNESGSAQDRIADLEEQVATLRKVLGHERAYRQDLEDLVDRLRPAKGRR